MASGKLSRTDPFRNKHQVVRRSPLTPRDSRGVNQQFEFNRAADNKATFAAYEKAVTNMTRAPNLPRQGQLTYTERQPMENFRTPRRNEDLYRRAMDDLKKKPNKPYDGVSRASPKKKPK